MSKRSLLIFVIILLVTSIIVSFNIPRETKPSADTRIILEHNYNSYIAPKCFVQSNATNYIQDSILEEAQKSNYEPHDSCTVKALENEKDSLIISLLKDVGIINKKWDNW